MLFFNLLRLYCQARENHTSLITPQRILLNVTIAFGHLLSRRGREGMILLWLWDPLFLDFVLGENPIL